MSQKVRINHQIRAKELRVISSTGENLGLLSLQDALRKAEEDGLDLIEISPNSPEPVAKIMDYGKYQYEENKKTKASRSKSRNAEIKSIQIKIGTGEHDLELKAKKASEWLQEGHRVKVELFLSGRAKYMDPKFLSERLERVLRFISEEYKIAEPLKRGPKGLTVIIERS